jgi:hypothetical protein
MDFRSRLFNAVRLAIGGHYGLAEEQIERVVKCPADFHLFYELVGIAAQNPFDRDRRIADLLLVDVEEEEPESDDETLLEVSELYCQRLKFLNRLKAAAPGFFVWRGMMLARKRVSQPARTFIVELLDDLIERHESFNVPWEILNSISREATDDEDALEDSLIVIYRSLWETEIIG